MAPDNPPQCAVGTGFYAGAGIGDFGIKLVGNSFDADDFGHKFFGGYNFIKYLGVEIEDTKDVYLWSASLIWRF